MFLDINVYQGQISGTAVSQRLCKYSLYDGLSVEGRMAGNDGFAIFWDFVGGKRQAFAKAKLHVDRANGLLDVNVTEQAPGLFPDAFRLGKGSDYASSEEEGDEPVDQSEKAAMKQAEKADQARYRGAFCKDAVERVERATKQAKP
ncbi:hypothetical protein BCh11DRAFT_06100 [Burkholderia sp. Ch1-1]|nr:hypothetical protein BCh11DRAFT_06100 [Burkholderia sp. Ch1-1]